MATFRELKDSLARVEAGPEDIGVAAMLDYFLTSIQGTVSEMTWDFYRRHLRNFVRFVGRDRLAGTISDDDVNRWLAAGWEKRLPGGEMERRPYGQSSRHGAIAALKRAFSWSKKKKLIAEDALAEMKGPGIKKREAVLDESAVRNIIDVSDGPFRDLIEFMWQTGCRPSEAARLESRDVRFDEGLVRMHSKTTKATGKQRIIYLNSASLEILRRNAAKHPEGPLFRNTKGAPWSRHAMAQRFARLRRQLALGTDGTAEAIRHGFGTDGAMKLKPMVLAHLMGHTSPAMIGRYYVHLDRRPAEMREAMDAVRGSGASKVLDRPPVGSPDQTLPVVGTARGSGGPDDTGLDVGA